MLKAEKRDKKKSRIQKMKQNGKLPPVRRSVDKHRSKDEDDDE